MAFCTKCGSPINESYAFCTSCGAKVVHTEPEPKPAPERATQAVVNPYTEQAAPKPKPEPIPQPVHEMTTQAIEKPAPEHKPDTKPAEAKKEEFFDESTRVFGFGGSEKSPAPKQEPPKAEPAPVTVPPTAKEEKPLAEKSSLDKTISHFELKKNAMASGLAKESPSKPVTTKAEPSPASTLGGTANFNAVPTGIPKKENDRTVTVNTGTGAPAGTPYDRPPVNTYEQKYGVPAGPEPRLPLNTEPYRGKPDKKGEYGVVGTLYYFFMSLLYLIPIVGLIMSIVMSFGGTINQNKRAFARAALIFEFIAILMLFVSIILGIIFEDAIFSSINDTFGWSIDTWRDLFDIF